MLIELGGGLVYGLRYLDSIETRARLLDDLSAVLGDEVLVLDLDALRGLLSRAAGALHVAHEPLEIVVSLERLDESLVGLLELIGQARPLELEVGHARLETFDLLLQELLIVLRV